MQISYSEAFDPYHSIYRLIRARKIFGFGECFHFDLIRVIDFYMLFPFCIQNMSLMSSDTGWRKISKSYSWMSPYGGLPNEISVFSRMEVFQEVAANTLVLKNILSAKEWEDKIIKFRDVDLPGNLEERASEANSSMADVMEILIQIKERYPLMGKGGLKDRSGLMEFRYDPV